MSDEILNKVGQLLENVRKTKPLVHSITNYVTATDCANIVLAIGGSPTMADFSKEVEAIAGIAQAVELNMGIINDDMVNAMIIAGKKAKEYFESIPPEDRHSCSMCGKMCAVRTTNRILNGDKVELLQSEMKNK